MATQTLSVGPNPRIEIDRVGGDLVIKGWERADVEVSDDDAQIEHDNGMVTVSCGGDLNLSAPHGASLTVGIVGGDLRLENLDGLVEVSIVGGDAVLRNLTGQVELHGSVGGDTRLENVDKVSMNARKKGLGPDISERVRRQVEKAARRAEQKMRRAEIKIQQAGHRAHRAHVRANFEMGRRKWDGTPGSFPPGGINEPVSDEERMAILKMLQGKKITAEEADKLLAALEGGE